VKDIKRLGGSIEFKILERDGAEDKQILNEIKSNKPDLTVLASRGKKGIERLYLGSITEAVLKLTESSVFVAKLIR
jgi:nucleotide-binding universal stress UspA family protein